jgi:hypothetical protein
VTITCLLLYTDPGTGAMLWQLLAASLIGVAFYFRHYLAKIKSVFGSKKR